MAGIVKDAGLTIEEEDLRALLDGVARKYAEEGTN